MMELSPGCSETMGCSNNQVTPPSSVTKSPSPAKPSTGLECPPKKRARFSISSILGEEDRKSTTDTDTSAAQVNRPEADPLTTHYVTTHSPGSNKENRVLSSPESPRKITSSPISSTTSPTAAPPHLPDAARYNAAFLAQFSNPDVAKLYRWPLLWSPFMGIQHGGPATAHPGLLRPPFLQPPPFLHQPSRDKVHGQRSPDEVKSLLEAGEIVRPVAHRSHDPQSVFPHSFLEPPHNKNTHSSSPGPFLEGRRDIDTDIKPVNEDRKPGSYLDADLDNDMVEIEVDEPIDSDTEGGENGTSMEEGSLRGSSCERKKKTRTVFSRSQIFQLETMFDMKRYLSSSERAGLAKALNMTETQVKIWFQNRRNKWKRQIAAEMEAANMSQVTGHRLMQLPYMYGHEELSRGVRAQLPVSPIHSGHPVVPPSVHHYYGGILRGHTS